MSPAHNCNIKFFSALKGRVEIEKESFTLVKGVETRDLATSDSQELYQKTFAFMIEKSESSGQGIISATVSTIF